MKVADFGFAQIKENATMTRSEAPCWTAPEIIRGEAYDERVDVYAFGIIMWEVLTRREPYSGRNFMDVVLEVIAGQRPHIPSDCPESFEEMMTHCWQKTAGKRPAMADVLAYLDSELSGNSDDHETGYIGQAKSF